MIAIAFTVLFWGFALGLAYLAFLKIGTAVKRRKTGKDNT